MAFDDDVVGHVYHCVSFVYSRDGEDILELLYGFNEGEMSCSEYEGGRLSNPRVWQ